MKLEALTICVNYSDYLERIIPYNKNYFDKWIIITTYEDEDTLKICDKYDIWCLRTKAFDDPGESRDISENKFNKGSAINKGLKHLDKDGWVLHFDADIIIPKNRVVTVYSVTPTLEKISLTFGVNYHPAISER